MSQNTQFVQRAWQKIAGAAGLGNLDPLYQFFTQLNALVNDTQNVVYQSASLTGGGVTVPTFTGFRFLAGGTYGLSTGVIPALTGATIPINGFGLWFFTVDNTNTNHQYPGAGNGATARSGLTLPSPLPSASEAVFGVLEIATDGTHTFVPGTTLLNAAGITATLINLTGDTGFTAVSLVEMDVA